MTGVHQILWSIPGLFHVRGLFSPEEQAALLAQVDSQPTWNTQLRRRTQHYGWRYDYTSKALDRRDYLGPLPGWLREPGQRAAAVAGLTALWDQAIVNEYLLGQGIAEHSDSRLFGPVVMSISLGSTAQMLFRPYYKAPQPCPVELHPGDVLILSGLSRTTWTHQIEPGAVRARRVSITYRTV